MRLNLRNSSSVIQLFACLALVLMISGCEDKPNDVNGFHPSPPENLTGSAISDHAVTLSWSSDNNATTGFILERKTFESASWREISDYDGTSNHYLDDDLSEATTYCYRVTSLIQAKSSEPSSAIVITTQPAKPENLTLSQIGANTAVMRWEDLSEVEEGFTLQRRQGLNGDYESLTELEANTTEYTDESLLSNVRYFYRLSSVFEGIGSLWSNEMAAYTTPEPSNLVARNLSDSIIWLGWYDNSSFETAFLLERKTQGHSDWESIAEIHSNRDSYTDATVSEGTTYLYRIRALFETAQTSPSNIVTICTPPLSPFGLTATRDEEIDNMISLRWQDASSMEDGFEIQRCTRQNQSYATIANVVPNTLYYIDSDLPYNQVYIYRIRATLDTLRSIWSEEATDSTTVLTPLRPENLVASPVTPYQIRLQWDDKSDNEDGYILERSLLNNGDWSHTDALPKNTERYFDSGLEQLTTYFYRIKTFNEFGESPFSNIAEITTPQDVPIPPDEFHVVDISYLHVDIGWNDNSDDELGFIIERRLIPSFFWDRIAELDAGSTSFHDDDVLQQNGYSYRVASFNDAGNSFWSAELFVVIPEGPPNTPVNLAAQTFGHDEIWVTWERVSVNEDGFILERKSSNDEDFQVLDTTRRQQTYILDDELTPGTWYWYRVKAFNHFGLSDYSNIDSTQTDIISYFMDNFEGYEPESQPESNGWNAEQGGTSKVEVTDTFSYRGDNSVLFSDPDIGDTNFGRLHLDHDDLQKGILDCWLYISPGGRFGITGFDSRDYVAYEIVFKADNSFDILNGPNYVTTRGYPLNHWFELTLTYDVADRKYKLSFDGDTVYDNLSLGRADHQAISRTSFVTYRETVQPAVFLDDLTIQEDIE